MRFLYLRVFLIFCLIFLISSCPFAVQQYCACIDQLDGVLLNCTASSTLDEQNARTTPSKTATTTIETPAIQMMRTLKSNQAHLGLLKLLSIHNTAIPILTENFFSGLYIKRLELINCGIEVVQKGAFKGQEGILQELLLNGNNIEEMPSEALQQMSSLIRLDLSNNSIMELKSEHALPRLQKLSDINLSHNRISGMHKTFFENVKATLQTINLGHNWMEEVPASALRSFRVLMALHLHNNRLLSLPQLSFMNLPLLSLLNLATNQIGSIHRRAFLNAPQLRFLYLSANRLTEVQPFQFSSFEHLEMLDLSNNQIEALPNDSFTGLPALRQLYLGENKISQIPQHAFPANSSIAVLIMEHNQVSELGKDSFQNLRQLQQLSLKANKLRSIDAGAFQGNPALVMLDLSRNELIDLAPATFLSQLNLLLVDLNHNRIIRTPFGAFGRRVATVLLQENPLVCTERIHMLQQGNGIFIPNSEDTICAADRQFASSTNGPMPNRAESADGQFSDPDFGISPNEFHNSQSPQQAGPSSSIEDDESPENPSAFVQQIEQQQQQQLPHSTVQIRLNGDDTPSMFSGHPTRLPNIKPIRITPESIRINTGREHERIPISTLGTSAESTEPIPLSESIAGRDFGTESGGTTMVTAIPLEKASTVEDPEARFKPHLIYPHPVPFLKLAPKMHTATHVGGENANIQTLPPSIVIADSDGSFGGAELARPPQGDFVEDQQNQNANEAAGVEEAQEGVIEVSSIHGNYTSTNYEGKFEEFPLEPAKNTVDAKAIQPVEVSQGQSPNNLEDAEQHSIVNTPGKSSLPTAIVVICMGTVAVVMCSVFVGLCVARKRQLRQMSDIGINLTATGHGHGAYGHHNSEQHSPISSSYMSAARAAQMSNYFYPKQLEETLQRGMRRSVSGTLNRLPPAQDDIYGWLYTPAGYNAYKK